MFVTNQTFFNSFLEVKRWQKVIIHFEKFLNLLDTNFAASIRSMIPRFMGPALPESNTNSDQLDKGRSGNNPTTGASLPGDLPLNTEEERLLELVETQSETGSSAFGVR